MNRNIALIIEIAINFFVAFIAWLIFNHVTGGENEFFLGIRGFLLFYIVIATLDLIWKFIKRKMRNKRK